MHSKRNKKLSELERERERKRERERGNVEFFMTFEYVQQIIIICLKILFY